MIRPVRFTNVGEDAAVHGISARYRGSRAGEDQLVGVLGCGRRDGRRRVRHADEKPPAVGAHDGVVRLGPGRAVRAEIALDIETEAEARRRNRKPRARISAELFGTGLIVVADEVEWHPSVTDRRSSQRRSRSCR